jgi:hypothetical protein
MLASPFRDSSKADRKESTELSARASRAGDPLTETAKLPKIAGSVKEPARALI